MKNCISKLFAAVAAIVMLASCGSREKIVYIQGADEVGTFENVTSYNPTIQPDDRLTIIVNCKEPELAAPFNMMLKPMTFTGGNQVTASYGSGNPQIFWVNPEGNISYPTIGDLHVVGMTRVELKDKLENYLKENGYIQDPIVVVEFYGAKYSVLGEVTRPGQFPMASDRVSILDAIAQAGDLTVFGERDKVRLVRDRGGKQVVASIDLRDKELMNSEYYYLQPNDVLYVEPNKTKASNREVSNLYSFGISLVSLAATFANIIINVTK